MSEGDKRAGAAVGRDARILEELYAVIDGRHGAAPEVSYTAKLFHQGVDKIAKKLGEEAVETLIEGVRGDRERLAAESADLLYHLLVLWSARGVRPEAVWRALEWRLGTSGLEEKKKRRKKRA